jgi:hypothetical protein
LNPPEKGFSKDLLSARAVPGAEARSVAISRTDGIENESDKNSQE